MQFLHGCVRQYGKRREGFLNPARTCGLYWEGEKDGQVDLNARLMLWGLFNLLAEPRG